MTCAGNPTEYCGAGNRVQVYQNTVANVVEQGNLATVGGFTYGGCYTEGSSSRALIGASTASDGMTVESCAAFCDGFSLFGVEYGREVSQVLCM